MGESLPTGVARGPRHPWLAALVMCTVLGGCGTKTFRSETRQPQLRLSTSAVERTSIPLFIVLRNMNLPRWVFLPNTAYFTWVSKDRLRIHVTLHHSWRQLSDPSRWRVWLEDEFGNRFYPVDLDRKRVRSITRRYDGCAHIRGPSQLIRQRCAQANQYAPLSLVTIFRGDGDYVFYSDELFQADRAHMELVMQRPGMEFRYRWDFVDGAVTTAQR